MQELDVGAIGFEGADQSIEGGERAAGAARADVGEDDHEIAVDAFGISVACW